MGNSVIGLIGYWENRNYQKGSAPCQLLRAKGQQLKAKSIQHNQYRQHPICTFPHYQIFTLFHTLAL